VSTSDIRALIERTKAKALEIRASAVWWPDAGIMADKALIQLDAIEQAAKALEDGPPGVINDKAIDAWLDLGESIAKDAK
jgi:hypothetical protein